jgi:hypothetical protein
MKVQDLIEYLKTLPKKMEVFALDQMISGMDGDLYPVIPKTMMITTLEETQIKNYKGQITYYTPYTMDATEKFLLINHKYRQYANKEELYTLPEITLIEEDEQKIDVEEIEVEEIII